MTTRFIALGIPLIALCWLSGRAESEPFELPEADALELWEYITQGDGYRSWQPFPTDPDIGGPPVRVTEEPHGAWVAIYVNDVALQSLFDPLDPFSLRYGSVLVKENYPNTPEPPAPDTLLSLTVMYKVNGYRTLPDENEWFWAMYSPSGRVLQLSDQSFLSQEAFKGFRGEVQAGKPWFCIHCHLGAKETSTFAVGDFVYKLRPFLGVKD